MPQFDRNNKQWHWNNLNAILNQITHIRVCLRLSQTQLHILLHCASTQIPPSCTVTRNLEPMSCPIPQTALQETELGCMVDFLPPQSLNDHVTDDFAGWLTQELVLTRITLHSCSNRLNYRIRDRLSNSFVRACYRCCWRPSCSHLNWLQTCPYLSLLSSAQNGTIGTA